VSTKNIWFERSRIITVFLWILAGFFLFILPWYVGGLHPVKGESFAFGFNNKAGVVGLGMCLALLAVLKTWVFNPAGKNSSLRWLSADSKLFPPFHKARGEYLVLGACSLAMVLLHLVWNHILLMPYWGGENSYFLGRMDLVALGYKPYVDFQFNYGPALLYVPLWMSRFSLGQLGFEDAYALAVAFSFVLGFGCVFIFLRAIEIPSCLRPLILLLCLLMWMCMTMGLNYSPLRFTILPAALVLFHRSVLCAWRGLPPLIVAPLSSLLCTGCCFLISPEMGIAATVGLLACASICLFSQRVSMGLGTLAGLLLGGGIFSLSFPGYLYGVLSFSSGANNFPIYPDLVNLLLLGAALLIIPGLLSSAWRGKADGRALLGAALAAAGLLLLPASLGRCDPGHVAINGFIIFVLMFAAMASFGRVFLNVWMAIFAVVFVLMGQLSYWDGYRGLYAQVFQIRDAYAANPALIQQWQEAWGFQRSWSASTHLDWRKTVPFPSGLEDLVKDKKVGIPFGADIGIERLLKLQNKFGIIYHESPIPEWYAPKDIERAARECAAFDLLLVPDSISKQASGSIDMESYRRGISDFLSGLMLYPVHSVLKNSPYIPEVELAQTLLPKCDEVGRFPGYVVLKPKVQ
jgi:hypothetical protein